MSRMSQQSSVPELRGEQHYYYPPYITLAHLFHAPEGWAIHNRVMNQYVLQYVVDGVAQYPVEDRPYVTRTGDLLIHRPYERHSILTVPNEPYVCISIVFHFGSVPFPMNDLIGTGHLLGNFKEHPADNMLSQLVAHYRQPGFIHQVQCQRLLMHILTEAAERRAESGRLMGPEWNKARLVLVRNYIVNHYQEPVRHTDLERVSGLSRNYIIVRFKQAYGMTPMQYLTWIRVNKAKELAIQTNLSIGEIANRVGYADVHTFGKMFKKQTGMSLSQFCAGMVTHPS